MATGSLEKFKENLQKASNKQAKASELVEWYLKEVEANREACLDYIPQAAVIDFLNELSIKDLKILDKIPLDKMAKWYTEFERAGNNDTMENLYNFIPKNNGQAFAKAVAKQGIINEEKTGKKSRIEGARDGGAAAGTILGGLVGFLPIGPLQPVTRIVTGAVVGNQTGSIIGVWNNGGGIITLFKSSAVSTVGGGAVAGLTTGAFALASVPISGPVVIGTIGVAAIAGSFGIFQFKKVRDVVFSDMEDNNQNDAQNNSPTPGKK